MEKDVKNKKKEKSILFKTNKKGRKIHLFMNVLRVLVVPILFLVKPFRYYGNHKVKDGACVYIGNHYSATDPLYFFTTTWEGVHFVYKSNLKKTPVIGWALRKLKGIPANRDGADIRTLLDCLKCLKNGDKLALFPEGMRNKTSEEMLEFKHGAAMLSIRAKVPIIPLVIYKRPRLFRVTHVLVGEPIELTEYYDKKLKEEDFAEIDKMLKDHMLNMKEEHKKYLQAKQSKA